MSGLPSFLSVYFLVSSWTINGICVRLKVIFVQTQLSLQCSRTIKPTSYARTSCPTVTYKPIMTQIAVITISLKPTHVPLLRNWKSSFISLYHLLSSFHLQAITLLPAELLVLPHLSIFATLTLLNSSLIGCNILQETPLPLVLLSFNSFLTL